MICYIHNTYLMIIKILENLNIKKHKEKNKYKKSKVKDKSKKKKIHNPLHNHHLHFDVFFF